MRKCVDVLGPSRESSGLWSNVIEDFRDEKEIASAIDSGLMYNFGLPDLSPDMTFETFVHLRKRPEMPSGSDRRAVLVQSRIKVRVVV